MIKYSLSVDAVCDECGKHIDGFDVYEREITGLTIGNFRDQIGELWDRVTVDDGQLCERCADEGPPVRFDDLDEGDRFRMSFRGEMRGPFEKLEGRDYKHVGDDCPPKFYFGEGNPKVLTHTVNSEVEVVEVSE